MLELIGKYNSCKVFNDNVEEAAIGQIYEFLNHPAFEGTKIRIQPDVHAGAGAVIGFTSTLSDKVIPNVIGVDGSCGVLTVNVGSGDIDLPNLDGFIHLNVPAGCTVNKRPIEKYILDRAYAKTKELAGKPLPSYGEFLKSLEDICKRTKQDYNYVVASIGSLGGGNHFIELGKCEKGDNWLTIHSGSRNFGLKIALHHQRIAKEQNSYGELSYLEGDLANQYIADSKIANVFARLNRCVMMETMLGMFERRPTYLEFIESVHNYLDESERMIRKGAIAAHKGQKVIIPWNMRDGLIIGIGKGNEDWNNSAPHGAGRIMGRNVAKKTLDLEEYKRSMEGVYSSCVCKDTIDESPMVYKNADEIQSLIEDTVEIVAKVKPIYNFKAGGE